MGAVAIPLAIAGLGLATAAMNRGGSSTAGQMAPGGTRRRTPTQQAQTRLGTDARQRTPNAEDTGRKAVPRGTAVPRSDGTSGTPKPPDTDKAKADAASAARRQAMRTRRKGASQRPGTLLTGPVSGSSVTPRTLLGYS